jgi:hypothetical protein
MLPPIARSLPIAFVAIVQPGNIDSSRRAREAHRRSTGLQCREPMTPLSVIGTEADSRD